MSNLKRKDAPGGHPPAKAAKQSKEAHPSKTGKSKIDKPKTDKPKVDKPQTDKAKTEAAPKKAVVSVLKEEEALFPRGGGSVLTPLEQKQIQLEAKADALKEEFDTGGKPVTKKKRSASLKKSADKADKKTETKPDEDSVKIESLNFKVWKFIRHSSAPC